MPLTERWLRAAICAAALLLAVLPAAAQADGSPYSKLGYGVLRDHATSIQRQMGGVGYAMTAGRQINAMNPAAYAFTDSLTFLFDMGIDLQYRMSRENGNSEGRWGGGLDNLTLQVPISSRIGASAGLLPYSQVGYAFGSDITGGSEMRSGEGGLTELYLGVGARPLSGLSLGVNFSYLFGSVVNDLRITDAAYNVSVFEQVLQVRDWHLQAGLQYRQMLNKEDNITLGLSWSPGKRLLGNTWMLKYDANKDSDQNTGVTYPDTVMNIKTGPSFSLADSYGVGLSYTRGSKLFVEADLTYQPWSKAKYLSNDVFGSCRLADRYKVAVGMQYIPHVRGSYFRRTVYRAGFNWERDYVMVGDNHIKGFGIDAGFGFPAVNGRTLINLGFQYRHRQASPAALIKEDYFGVTLGVNFNEMWFFRRRIN